MREDPSSRITHPQSLPTFPIFLAARFGAWFNHPLPGPNSRRHPTVRPAAPVPEIAVTRTPPPTPARPRLERLERRDAPAAGDFDLSFDTDGKVTVDIDVTNRAEAVARQADGKLVLAGAASFGGNGGDFGLVRLNPDGSLDTTFDTDGKVRTDFGSNIEGAFAVAVQADGKIVAAGLALGPGTGRDFALARYNSNGSLDTS